MVNFSHHLNPKNSLHSQICYERTDSCDQIPAFYSVTLECLCSLGVLIAFQIMFVAGVYFGNNRPEHHNHYYRSDEQCHFGPMLRLQGQVKE